jgi:hypothetical protein
LSLYGALSDERSGLPLQLLFCNTSGIQEYLQYHKRSSVAFYFLP